METNVNHIQHIRRFAAVLGGLACALLASAAAAAPSFAMVPPPGAPAVAPSGPVTTTVIAGGMPGWQITLIAVGAALLTATAAVFLDRARTAHQNMTRAAV
jgi:hypothetical protein